MNVEVFFDTNIFVYTFDAGAPAKRDRARSLIREALEKGNGAISWQITQEFLNVALHKFKNPLTAGEASDYLDQVLTIRCGPSRWDGTTMVWRDILRHVPFPRSGSRKIATIADGSWNRRQILTSTPRPAP